MLTGHETFGFFFHGKYLLTGGRRFLLFRTPESAVMIHLVGGVRLAPDIAAREKPSEKVSRFPRLHRISPGRLKNALSPGCKNSEINCERGGEQTFLIHHTGFRHTFRSFRLSTDSRGARNNRLADLSSTYESNRHRLSGIGYPNVHCSSGNVSCKCDDIGSMVRIEEKFHSATLY